MPTDQSEPEEGRNTSLEHTQNNNSSQPRDPGSIVPAPRPRTGNVITSRQEKALRYMERKRTRHERISQQVVNASMPEENRVSSLPVLHTNEEIQKIPVTALELISAPTVETVQSRRKRWHRKIILRHLSRKRMRQSREQKQHEVRRFWITLSSVSFAFLAILLSLTGAGAFAAYRFYSQTQQQYTGDILTLRDLMPKDNLKMYDSKGVLIAQLTDNGIHTAVKYPDIASSLINATVATEDKNFWDNPGIDLTRIIQACCGRRQHNHAATHQKPDCRR